MDGQKNIDYKVLYEQECRKVHELEYQLEIDRIKLKKLFAAKQKGTKLCNKCMGELGHQKVFNIRGDKQGLKDFSDKVTDRIQKLKDKDKGDPNHVQGTKSHQRGLTLTHSESLGSSKHGEIHQPLSMVENFSIFGVSEQAMQASLQNSSTLGFEPQLLYSCKPASDVDRQATSLVFPSGIAVKRASGQKAKDKAIEMMSFCYTNLKSFVLRFKCQQDIDETQFDRNPFLSHINPERTLFCLCIGIHDYTALSGDGLGLSPTKIKKAADKMEEKDIEQGSLKGIQEDSTLKPSQSSFGRKQLVSSSKSTQSATSGVGSILISHRVFCISSYYPFLSFYEETLRRLINIVKMERLTIYKHNNEDIGETDSRFQLNKMVELFLGCMKDLNSRPVLFNRSYELRLVNHQKIILLTDWQLARTYFIEEWACAVLSVFGAEALLDVYTLMMLEDRLVFVCDNSHILTFTIYLFAHILPKPFNYAFQVVSIIPEQDFLGAPFPVVYGMLRKRKYIEQSSILQDYQNTYIFLSPEKADIVYTESKKHLLKARPLRLKAELPTLFKDLRRGRRADGRVPAKYEIEVQEYQFSSTMQERETAVKIVQKIHEYNLQQVVNKLPSSIEIRNLKNSIDPSTIPDQRDEHAYLIDRIKQCVKKNGLKEPFVQRLLDTQMISNFICK